MQIPYRANLASDDIPLLSAFQGQTVIVGKIDQDFELEGLSTTPRLQKEKQIPQAYYVHNVMPTGQGYQSVGYIEKIPPHPGHEAGVEDFQGIFVLRDVNENKSLFSPAGGKNYIFDRNVNMWESVNPIVGFENALVTVAYLDGETYVFYAKKGCFKYNKTTRQFDTVTLTGLVVTQINGICAANGYLLAWDDLNNVYRSQAVDNLNFTPDISLGSGSGIPEDIRGKIVVLLPITNGFIVYTTANAVAGIFQNNSRYPFIYREIQGSSGIVSADHVSWQDSLGEHYAWTISGMQKVDKSKATPVFPEVTDFLVAKIFEDYNTITDTFNITKLTAQLVVHVTVIGSRFIIISYGITNNFTHAIIYDLAFKRFGKLKIDHVDCFTYATPNLSGDLSWEELGDLSWEELGGTSWDDLGNMVETVEVPKEIVAFLQHDGTVNIINFDLLQIHENLIDNGDYEQDIMSASSNGGATLSRDNTQAIFGGWALKVVAANNIGSGVNLQKTNGFIPVTAGEEYLASAYLYAPTASVGKTLNFAIEWRNAAGVFVSASILTLVTLVEGWQQVTNIGIAPVNATQCNVIAHSPSTQGIFNFWVDFSRFHINSRENNLYDTLDYIGVLVLGKYQFVREKFLQLDEIEVENIDLNSDFALKLLSSVNGKTIARRTNPLLVEKTESYRKYITAENAKNHSIAFKGTFHMTSAQLVFHPTSDG